MIISTTSLAVVADGAAELVAHSPHHAVGGLLRERDREIDR